MLPTSSNLRSPSKQEAVIDLVPRYGQTAVFLAAYHNAGEALWLFLTNASSHAARCGSLPCLLWRPSNSWPGQEPMWLAAQAADFNVSCGGWHTQDRCANGGSSPWKCAKSNDCKGALKELCEVLPGVVCIWQLS